MDVHLSLSIDDLQTLIAALDCYEYWELGQDLPRNNGRVFLPGDHLEGTDLYWSERATEEQAVAIDRVRHGRTLAERLQALVL